MIKKTKTIPWNLLDIFIVIFLELLAFFILKPILSMLTPLDPVHYSIFTLFAYLLQTFVSLGIIYLFTFNKYKIKLKDLGFVSIPWVKTLVYVFFLWLLTTILLTSLDQFFLQIWGQSVNGFLPQDDHVPLFGDNVFGHFSLIFSAFIIAPISEEIMFRGFIMQGLFKYFSPLISILLTALIFAGLHFEFSSIIPLFMIGSVLGWIFYKKKSIYACLLFHAINNGIALIAEFIMKNYV